MSITNATRRFEQRFDAKAERFIWHHPLLGSISIFVGMPLLVLACVCISTIVIAFPMAWLLGWLPIRADARYCSNACRQKDYRHRKTAAHTSLLGT